MCKILGMAKRNRLVSKRDVEVRERVGAAIRRIRGERGRSGKWLADEINVDEATMSRVERGKAAISTDILDRVAIALDTSVLSLYENCEAA